MTRAALVVVAVANKSRKNRTILPARAASEMAAWSGDVARFVTCQAWCVFEQNRWFVTTS
jgi:hypothetical protein